MAINYYDKFVAKLQEFFMIDHAELDFGIYRIMNQKHDEIQKFLQVDLLPQVKQALQGEGGNTQQAKQRMAEIEASVGGNVEVLPKGTPMRDEYDKLKAQLAGGSAEDMEGEVFSHLVTFFSRYYDGGDFLSKRRYKDNTYAIPYNGEEVKLHWANSDQYYIKTSEYFRNYTFVLPTNRRKVHFVLKDASTEQNNNKAQNNMERRFAIWEPENAEDSIVEVTPEGELNVYFTYELMPKATKQDSLKEAAVEAIKPLIPEGYEELLTVKAPTTKEPNRTLLEKHLTDYTAKNSFDYFIHKDLGGFLSRELDFYIKNEVLHIDDLDPQHIQSQLSVVKAIKQVGQKIIQMLAQLENFQRKLWLKKKFVVQSDYCITLDRVPEKLYPAIIANEAQRKEWVRLFAIDEIKGDMMTEAYSEPLTIEFLKQNPFLVLDTAFFDAKFKHLLVASMENIDEQTNGLLINSENFQALQLLQEKYSKRVKCVYIDPPYNIQGDGFLYKDNYKVSSWTSMMDDRIKLGVKLLDSGSTMLCSIGEDREGELRLLFNKQGFETVIPYLWKSRAKPTNTGEAKLRPQIVGEFVFMGLTNAFQKFYPITSGIERKYNKKDEFGNYRITTILTSNLGRYKRETLRFSIAGYTPPTDKRWKAGQDEIQALYDTHRIGFNEDGEPYRKHYEGDEDEQSIPFWTYIPEDISGTAESGKTELSNYIPEHGFDTVKPKQLIQFFLNAITTTSDIIIDYFAGSGTTADAIIEQNIEDEGNRKFVLVDSEYYFDTLILPRTIKRVYSSNWRNGKPVSRNGISQCFKYIRLEQYEDTLNNLEIKAKELEFQPDEFKESYMLSYMLDTETRDSLLNLKWFENPFEMTLKTTKDNELVETKVDMVETFNYLIGLNVETEDWYQDDNICVVQGRTHREGLKTLVIWRNCKEVNNDQLCMFFDKMDFRTRDTEFDLIYVNGDNTLPNLRRDEEHWKVVLTEEEFQKRMFEEE